MKVDGVKENCVRSCLHRMMSLECGCGRGEIRRGAEGKERRGTQNNSRSASVLPRKYVGVGNMLQGLLREGIWEK